jgi:hypothetical protein
VPEENTWTRERIKKQNQTAEGRVASFLLFTQYLQCNKINKMDGHVARFGESLNAYDITAKEIVRMDHLEGLGIEGKLILTRI